MRRRFYFHPDRRKEVMDAVLTGKLSVASQDDLMPCKYLPLKNDRDQPILGWWVEEMEMADWCMLPRETLPQSWPRMTTRYEPR